MEKDLQKIFTALKKELQAFEGPLTAKMDFGSRYELWSVKDLVIEGRKRKEVYFAGLIIQKGYVGFYHMPVYMQTEMRDLFAPELLALLKGKSCFHIKTLDDALLKAVRDALKRGFSLYKQRGWVD